MIRRPPRSTLDRSSAASDVYKRQLDGGAGELPGEPAFQKMGDGCRQEEEDADGNQQGESHRGPGHGAVSYTHLRAHETVLDLVCRLLLEKKKQNIQHNDTRMSNE